MTDGPARKRVTAEAFGARADRYRSSPHHRRGADLDRVASWCDGAERALDIATGGGHTAAALVDAGVPSVVASDAAVRMVETAVAAHAGIEGAVADAERLPFEVDAFDAVSCRMAAHHFPDPEAFVAEVARVLRPGGVFALEDNVAPEDAALAAFLHRVERLHDPTHVESYPMATWRTWLTDAGFAVEAAVELAKPLPFEDFVAGMGDSTDEDALWRLLLDAPPDVASFFDIRTDGDEVRSFASPKGLLRAVLRG